MTTKEILVTGGLGTIGRPLISLLRQRGHEVWSLDRSHSETDNYIRCDAGEFRQLQTAFEGRDFDVVYHLGAEFGRRNGEEFYETMWRSNVVGMKNMLLLQREHGFGMVFSSSSEVYGDYDGVMSEDVPDRVPIRQLNDYAMSKRVNEMQIMNEMDRSRTETVIVRLFNTYGPGEYYSPYRNAICIFVYHALKGLPYVVYTEHQRTFSYVDDTIQTLANIVDRFKSGKIYNIAGSDLVDMRTVSDLVLQAAGRDDRLVEYRDVEPATTLEKKVDTTRAIQDLDHAPEVPLEEGIRRTVEWQRRVYGVK